MVPLVSVEYLPHSLPRLGRWRKVERPRPASRTPEGRYGRCPVCNEFVCVEFSDPGGDAPCPCCGQLLWLAELRWPFVCEDQGLPLRGGQPVYPRRSLPRLVRSLVARVARRLRPRPRKSRREQPARPSSSTMYDPWVDG
jgi:hypothetical protein